MRLGPDNYIFAILFIIKIIRRPCLHQQTHTTMQDHITQKNLRTEASYRPWTDIIMRICDHEDFQPAEIIRRFWDRYTLPESTLPLYQLHMASKGRAAPRDSLNGMLSHPIQEETLDIWFRDLCEAVIAFSYLTRFAQEQIIFVKPQTVNPDANR